MVFAGDPVPLAQDNMFAYCVNVDGRGFQTGHCTCSISVSSPVENPSVPTLTKSKNKHSTPLSKRLTVSTRFCNARLNFLLSVQCISQDLSRASLFRSLKIK